MPVIGFGRPARLARAGTALALAALLAGEVVVARAQPVPAGARVTSGMRASRSVAGSGDARATNVKVAPPVFDAALDQRLVRRHRDGIALMIAGVGFTAGGVAAYAIGESGHAKISAGVLVGVGLPAVVIGNFLRSRACRGRLRARGLAVAPLVTDRSVGVAVGGTLPW